MEFTKEEKLAIYRIKWSEHNGRPMNLIQYTLYLKRYIQMKLQNINRV